MHSMARNDSAELVERLERIKKLAAELSVKLTDSAKAKALAKRIEREVHAAIELRKPVH
jgi:hypothetical protein